MMSRILQIFIGDPHLFRAPRQSLCVFNLKPLPLRFFQRLVIRQLAHQFSHFGAKMLLQLQVSGVGILHGIV